MTWMDTEVDLHQIKSGFHGAFPTVVACKQGTLTLPDTWFRPPFGDLRMIILLRPVFPNWCLFSTFLLENRPVLSRICIKECDHKMQQYSDQNWWKFFFNCKFIFFVQIYNALGLAVLSYRPFLFYWSLKRPKINKHCNFGMFSKIEGNPKTEQIDKWNDRVYICKMKFQTMRILIHVQFNPLGPNSIYTEENHDFTIWVCYLKVWTKPKKFFTNSLFYRFYACIIYDTLGISGISYSSIPLVYRLIEQNDKILHVYVHRVKYEQFPNLID